MKINEIFKSIQGESSYAGLPCVFVRTTGCHLRCRWCDTAYAFHEGHEYSVESILQEVRRFECRFVELTGGEPLLQEESPLLIATLLNEGYQVLVETGGSVPIKQVDSRAIIIMDIKCPGSGMDHTTLWENLACLKDQDEVKFVIADRSDYDWAKGILNQYSVLQDKIIHFSPVFGQMPAKELAGWILEEALPVRFQLQMHKYIWDTAMKGI